jgi:hypothetical protein
MEEEPVMSPTRLAVVAVALVPAVAEAQQRTPIRGTRENTGELIRESPVGLRLTTRDVESISPLKLLMDKRKDLKLTDEQTQRIRDLDAALKERTREPLKRLDSLRTAARPRVGVDTAAERVRLLLAREEVTGVVTAIRSAYDAALKEALPILGEEQRAKADELLAKQRREAEEMLREKLGAGGGRGGRRGGG